MEGDENIWAILPQEIVVIVTAHLRLQDVGRLASVSCLMLDIIVQNNLVWKGMCTRKPFSLKTLLTHVKFGRKWEENLYTNSGSNKNSYENEPNADQFNYRLLLKEYLMLAIFRTKLRDYIKNYSHPASWAEIGIRQEEGSTSDPDLPTQKTDALLRSKLYYVIFFAKTDGILPTEFKGIRVVYEQQIEEKGFVLTALDTAANKVTSVWRRFTKK